MPLAGKVAIVTGAAQGIGRAVAEALADHGASLGLVDVNADALEELAAALRGKDQHAVAVAADVSSGAAVRQMVERVVAAFGTVHILVNNAGVLRNSPVMEMPESEWDLVWMSA
jgi:NAD(P)-dependent dehydrogenase (short-subunit alcohol dehydrogenase family)